MLVRVRDTMYGISIRRFGLSRGSGAVQALAANKKIECCSTYKEAETCRELVGTMFCGRSARGGRPQEEREEHIVKRLE